MIMRVGNALCYTACYNLLYNTILCCASMRCAMLYYAKLCYAMLYYTVVCYAHDATLSCAVLCLLCYCMYVSVFVCMSVCLYVCMYVCMYVCKCICLKVWHAYLVFTFKHMRQLIHNKHCIGMAYHLYKLEIYADAAYMFVCVYT